MPRTRAQNRRKATDEIRFMTRRTGINAVLLYLSSFPTKKSAAIPNPRNGKQIPRIVRAATLLRTYM